MRKIEAEGYVRVAKGAARSLFEGGEDVFILPCNIRIGNMWMQPMPIPRDEGFDRTVNAYTYYNCNAETGRYCSFYRKTA